MSGRVLYVVVCGAGPAGDVGELVAEAQSRGWTVQVIATPSGLGFVDHEALEVLTGRPLRSRHRARGAPRSPRADAIAVAPASYNTVNKLAAGIADTYALDVVGESVGIGVPTVIAPFVNAAYAARAPFRRSVESLRAEDVEVILESDPHPPGSGGGVKFPWRLIMDKVESAVE
ncbi:flavoprotein [Nocardiopsis coralliicola]